MFHILNEAGEPYSPAGTFIDVKDAARAARLLSKSLGVKLTPKPVIDDSWKERERARDYRPVPDGFPTVPDHFAHIDPDNPKQIRFTASPEHGMLDRKTTSLPGRYLTTYKDQLPYRLTADVIKDWAVEWDNHVTPQTLKFARTADEIERVYVEGPGSCMSGTLEGHYDEDDEWVDGFESSIHPVRVYAAGDLAVAFIERNGEITARCLVWPEKRWRNRIYGDELRLRPLLEAEGYTYQEVFEGARLKRIVEDDRLVMPYLDCGHSIRIPDDDPDHVVITKEGLYSVRETEGLASPDLAWCYECEDRYAEAFVYSSRHESLYFCADCLAHRAFRCECPDYYHAYYTLDMKVEMANGQLWSELAFQYYGRKCEGNGKNYPKGEVIQLNNGLNWSKEHFEQHGFQCARSNLKLPKTEGLPLPDGRWISKEWATPEELRRAA